MNMKKIALAAALCATALTAQANLPQVDFTVEAVVPDNNFYVTPVGGWDAQPQAMHWDESSMSLVESAPGKQLKMKNATGGIKAYLSVAPVLTSSASTDNIPLQVSLAGKVLPVTAASAVTLFDQSEAQTEQTVTMALAQANPLNERPAAGKYMGNVTMIFDTVTP
ncbi:CS1 type fimbrial major subunit [Cronobacter sakazakii]